LDDFRDRDEDSKIRNLRYKLPDDYNDIAFTYCMVDKLGMTEQEMLENYTIEELWERKAIDAYRNYVQRGLMPKLEKK
jgi:hypothetical protein